VAVEVFTPTQRTVERSLKLIATVHAYERVVVRTRVTGYLGKYDLDMGDRVTAGQVIAVVDTPEVLTRVVGIEATRKEYRAAVRVARAAKRLKTLKARRLAQLAKRDPRLVAGQKVDEARLAADLADAEIGAAQARLSSLDALEKQLEARLAFREITAPISGVVTRRFVDGGALVSPDLGAGDDAGAIIEIASLDRLRIRVPVPERDARFVKAGKTRLRLTVPQADVAGREVTVTRVRGDIDARSRTLTAEVTVDQPGAMMSGMLGTAELVAERRLGALVVPATALGVTGGKSHVFVVRNGDASLRRVTVGIDDGQTAEITDGLKSTDQVVIHAQVPLNDGDPVSVVEETK